MGDAVDTTTFHVIGDICLVKFRDELTLPRKREEARRIQILVHVKTVCELQGIEGELRTPIVRKLLGGETVTVHKEHGVLYKLDVAKIMFSKGNVNERQRLTGLVQRNERILDMFAGIGYFTLPLAKTALPREIVACEKNLVAYHYLKENIVLNKVGGVIPLRRDCRTLTYHHAFDRILMGYFPGTETFLPHALRMTKPGGTIHYHNIYREDELWDAPHKHIADACAAAKRTFRVLNEHVVKSYSPHVLHVVVDVAIDGKKE